MRKLAILLVVLVVAPALAQSEHEKELRSALASALVELAAFARDKKLPDEAKAYADEALALDASSEGAKKVKEKLVPGGAEADKKALAKKQDGMARKLASGFRELALLSHKKDQDAVFDGWLVRALELDLKGTGGLVESEWRASFDKGDLERAKRLLEGAEKVKHDEKHAKVLEKISLKVMERTPAFKTARAHPMQYLVTLPKNWTPDKKWPILVTVEGAGNNFAGNHSAFVGARNDLPFIIVTPYTFSNTNAINKQTYKYAEDVFARVEKDGRPAFDLEGLLAVIDDVRKDYSGAEKFFITGFSGGGNLTWSTVFAHPELLAAASPACGNFSGTLSVSKAPEREALAVKAFQGDKDEYKEKMLDAQWQSAKEIADQSGWKDVTREIVPGVGHSACVEKVLAFFKERLEKK